MASPDGKGSIIFGVLLLAGILSFSWTGPEDTFYWHLGQYFVIVIFTIFWLNVSYNLIKKTPQQKQQEQAKLDKAIQIDGNKGVTQAWYNQLSNMLECLLISLLTFLGTTMIHGIINSYPNSPEFNITTNSAKTWATIANTFSDRTLFLFIWLFDVLMFWAIALIYTYIDHNKSPSAAPFKIQSDFYPTTDDVIKCIKITMKNHIIALVCLEVFYESGLFSKFAPNGFSPELPSLFSTVMSLLTIIPITEIYFFGIHYLCHVNTWLYDNVHYFHHYWKTPFAFTTIYALPIEHIFVNMVSLIIGPAILGSHIVVWYIFIVGAVMKRILVHSGYHFPYFYPADIHDYHHSADWDNFGVIGVMDHVCGTDQQFYAGYQGTLAKRYFSCEYPMDKIINSADADDKKDNKVN